MTALMREHKIKLMLSIRRDLDSIRSIVIANLPPDTDFENCEELDAVNEKIGDLFESIMRAMKLLNEEFV